ncbi:MAG TPA: glycosyl hydrolase, partial [Puia sp.]|nr:glycosyl hydrolase [Puia sp.]
MKRRMFMKSGALAGSGYFLLGPARRSGAVGKAGEGDLAGSPDVVTGERLYQLFRDPAAVYRPFVRWWWNGDKIDKEELARELRLLKEAGIGGVEINPVKFPPRTDDMGKRSVQWLSPEWIDLLQYTLEQAAAIGLTCDLIVGSGWPFGAEYLQGDEQSQIVVAAPFHLEGPMEREFSPF